MSDFIFGETREFRILDWHLNSSAGVTPHNAEAALGLIPAFVSADDPRPAWEQFNERYVFGGWNPMLPGKFQMNQDYYLLFPGDPPLPPLASARLRDELILVYPHAFVAILQPNGDFSVARLD